MSLVIDILIFAIIFISVLVGYKKGFIKISVTAIGFIASFVLAFMLSSTVANFTYDVFFQEKMISTVNNALEEQGDVAVDNAVDDLFSSNKMIVKMAKLCDVTADDIKSEISADSKEISTVSQYIEGKVIRPAITFMLRVIFIILLFILLSILFRFLSSLLSKTFSLTVAKRSDPIVGGILGLFIGIVLAVIFCIILDTAVSLSSDGIFGISSETRDGSYLYRLINDISNWNI